jgi:hypothetical protein
MQCNACICTHVHYMYVGRGEGYSTEMIRLYGRTYMHGILIRM